jgi:hypothetical protein
MSTAPGIDATTVFEMHPESFDRTEDMVQKAKELFGSIYCTIRAM